MFDGIQVNVCDKIEVKMGLLCDSTTLNHTQSWDLVFLRFVFFGPGWLIEVSSSFRMDVERLRSLGSIGYRLLHQPVKQLASMC